MICIFKNTAKKKQLIETNGEYVLDNICTYGMITEGLNDEFTLEIEFEILDTVKKELYDLITEEGILKVEDEYGDEFFVINEIYKTSDSIRAIARQITIAETLDLFLEDVRPEKQNGAGALTHIFSNTTCTHEIVVNSDISTISTAYYNRKTVYEALHDADMSFQERWGGEVYRRQFNLHINNKVGSYRGVKIKSNKNLTGFEENTTKDTVCTRIYPKGFNGITIEEKYIDSENIGMYKRPISRVYTFEDVKVRDKNTGEDEEVFETLEEAQEELKERAKALFEEDKVDLIKAYYTINHVDLRTTEEYKNYSATEMTCIGDEVDVEEETLGIDIRTRVVKRKYNILAKEREETELSNVGLKRVITLPDLEKEIEKIPNTESFLEAAKEIATGLINAGIKNSHVVVRKNEILIMDTDDINTAQKVWRFNVNGLGYSSTGYHGNFGLAMTMDGSIVADFINVGILNANLIKAGVIKSLNEKTWINMEDGTFSFGALLGFDGTEMKMKESAFKIVDSNDVTIAYIGQDNWMRLQGLEVFGLGECMQNRGPGTRSLKLITTDGGATHIDFNGNETDNYTVRLIREAGSEYLKMLTKGLSVQSFTGSTPCGVEIRSNGDSAYLDFSYNAIDDYNARLILNNNDRNLHCYGDGLAVHGNLQVTGNKNCVQNTKNYGEVAFYATEDCESYFTDRSMDLFTVEKTADGTFERVILIDNAFKETVNLKEYNYTVEVIKQGWGDYRIKEQTSDYFIVESDREDFTFKYIVTARRKGYENVRLEKASININNADSEVSKK
jgi:phage minor structural protein